MAKIKYLSTEKIDINAAYTVERHKKKSLALQKTKGVRRKWRYKMVRRGENKMAED